MLEWLDCSSNRLTSLDVSHNSALAALHCYNNQIEGESMANLVKSLPDWTDGDYPAELVVVSDQKEEGNICLTSDVAIAAKKNWETKKFIVEDGWYEDYEGEVPSEIAKVLPFTSLRIYPNPAVQFVTLEGVEPDSEVMLYDLAGKKLLHIQAGEMLNNTFDLSMLADGTYFIVVGEESQQLIIKR